MNLLKGAIALVLILIFVFAGRFDHPGREESGVEQPFPGDYKSGKPPPSHLSVLSWSLI